MIATAPEKYLLKAELRALTDCARAAGQMAWLDANGWPYAISAHGWPKVARAYHDQRMGLAGGAVAPTPAGPDWSTYGLPKAAQAA